MAGKFENRAFMIKIQPTAENSLDLELAGNVLQVPSVALERFVRCRGIVSEEVMRELLAGLIIYIM